MIIKHFFYLFIFFINTLSAITAYFKYDLTIVGQVKFAESLPRLSIALIDGLKDDLKINFIPTGGYYEFNDIPQRVKKIINNSDRQPGKVAIFLDMLWTINSQPYLKVPKNSQIKIAYSMLESTQIPIEWSKILNEKFDAVVVPDEYYIEVYKNSGVQIPIFVIPCPMYLDEFLKLEEKIRSNKPFIFGMSAAFNERKNYDLLLRAFTAEYKNNFDFKLKLHGRAGITYPEIVKLIKELDLKNVELIHGDLSRKQYADFLRSLDCYVLLSKGEGFSLTPREALACEIPCVISNNTAHQTICNSGFVRIVETNIKERAYYPCFKKFVGHHFTTQIEDVQKALKDVYENHEYYLNKAVQAKNWVKQYEYKIVAKKFLTLVCPKKIIFGKENKIDKQTLITNSVKLFRKYSNFSGSIY